MTTEQKPAFHETKQISRDGVADGWWLIACALPDDGEFGPRMASYAVLHEHDACRIIEAANALYPGGWDVPACDFVMAEVKKLDYKRQVATYNNHKRDGWKLGGSL